MDVARIVGKQVIEELANLELRVNLSNPNKKIFIEIRDNFSYIFSHIIKFPWDGLPIEPQKKMLVMDVGRLNDSVSGFLMMKRGSNVYPILFNMMHNKEKDILWESNWKIRL